MNSNKRIFLHLRVRPASSRPLRRVPLPAYLREFSKAILAILLVLICLILPRSVYAKDNNILILLSGNEDVYLDVATTITNSTIKLCRNRNLECQDTNFEISQISSLDIPPSDKHRLIVTLGIKAAEYANKNFKGKLVLSALIPQNSNIASAYASDSDQHYLYLDQPLRRSILLIDALSDRFKNIGVMISNTDESSTKQLEESAAELDLRLHIEKVESSDQVGASLSRLLHSIDILLAVPDTKIHNKSTVSNILISTYRKRIPLIGFSSAYVKAGALAAAYSSPEDIAYHVRDNIVKVYSGENIGEHEQTAQYFTLLFNSEVARSLDFPLKSEAELASKMIKVSKDNDHD
ncbi:MAG: ABC transporter substrate binding protein [Candidatus Thiodiazotropha sp.]